MLHAFFSWSCALPGSVLGPRCAFDSYRPSCYLQTQYTMLLTSFKDDLQQHVNDDVTEAICYLQTQYTMHLTSFKDNLQQHVYNDVTEAMMSCWELEQALHTITGKQWIMNELTSGRKKMDRWSLEKMYIFVRHL